MSFQAGDVVSLKSGGAKMTVETINESVVVCVWSDGKKVYREGFPPTVLTKEATIEEFLEKLDKAEK